MGGDTSTTHDALAEGRPAAEDAPGPPTSTSGLGRFVGREDVAAHVARVLADPARPGVIVAGPAGLGKTRVLEECGSVARAAGRHLLRIDAVPAMADLPFGALRGILPPLDHDPGSWHRILREGADTLVATAGGPGALLVVDDLHQLDTGSAALLHQAVTDGKVQLLGALRTEDRPPPDLVTTLWRDGAVERIDLPPVSVGAAGELAESRLGGPVDGLAAQRLWSLTQGNPLHLHHLVVPAEDGGPFEHQDGLWRLADDLGDLSALSAVVERDLRDVPAGVRDVIELVAEADVLPHDVLVDAASADAVDAAERRGLVRTVDGPDGLSSRLAHPFYGEVLRDVLTPDARGALRRRIATAIEARPETARRTDHLLLLASWYAERAELDGAEREVLLAAARHVRATAHHSLSLHFADAARRARADFPSCWLVCDALDQLGRNQEAVRYADQALALAACDEERALGAIRRSQLLARDEGRQEPAIDLVQRTRAEVADPQWQAALVIQEGNLLLHEARLEEAVALVQPVVDATDATVVEAVVVLGPALAALGRGEAAVAVAERGQALLAAHPTDLAVGDLHLFDVVRALGHSEAGHVAEARAVAEAGYAAGALVADRWRQGWFSLILARLALLTGDLPEAAARFRESAFAFGTLDQPGYRAWGLGGLAGAVAQFGSLSDAEALAASYDQLPRHDVRFFEPDAHRCRAWVDVAAGRTKAAEERLRAAAAVALETGQVACEAAIVHDLARIGLATAADAERLADLAAGAEGALMEARRAHVTAIVDADPDLLTAAAERFEALGMALFAAEAWGSAAKARERAGDGRGARAAARQAHAALARCPGARTPGVHLVPDVRLRDRELEIARLAAGGASRREIAARTFLSVRTVDRHLNEAFTKLGIRSRDELAEALADLDGAGRS